MDTQNIPPARSGSRRKQASKRNHSNATGHSVTARLHNELMALMGANEQYVSAFPSEENLFLWHATIKGASGTVYGGLSYKLTMTFPEKYPYEAPVIKFVTPCFHPNVDDQGNICLDILKEKWSASYDARSILVSLQSLLGEPNIDSPLNTHAAGLWKNQDEYKKTLHDKYNQTQQ